MNGILMLVFGTIYKMINVQKRNRHFVKTLYPFIFEQQKSGQADSGAKSNPSTKKSGCCKKKELTAKQKKFEEDFKLATQRIEDSLNVKNIVKASYLVNILASLFLKNRHKGLAQMVDFRLYREKLHDVVESPLDDFESKEVAPKSIEPAKQSGKGKPSTKFTCCKYVEGEKKRKAMKEVEIKRERWSQEIRSNTQPSRLDTSSFKLASGLDTQVDIFYSKYLDGVGASQDNFNQSVTAYEVDKHVEVTKTEKIALNIDDKIMPSIELDEEIDSRKPFKNYEMESPDQLLSKYNFLNQTSSTPIKPLPATQNGVNRSKNQVKI